MLDRFEIETAQKVGIPASHSMTSGGSMVTVNPAFKFVWLHGTTSTEYVQEILLVVGKAHSMYQAIVSRMRLCHTYVKLNSFTTAFNKCRLRFHAQ